MTKPYHPLLNIQIKKFIDPELIEIPEIKNFLDEVNMTYKNFEEDYRQMEKILEISVSKINKKNK